MQTDLPVVLYYIEKSRKEILICAWKFERDSPLEVISPIIIFVPFTTLCDLKQRMSSEGPISSFPLILFHALWSLEP